MMMHMLGLLPTLVSASAAGCALRCSPDCEGTYASSLPSLALLLLQAVLGPALVAMLLLGLAGALATGVVLGLGFALLSALPAVVLMDLTSAGSGPGLLLL